MKKFYITTPIYYVNDVPHIGHTYTTLAADVLARWNRGLGEETFFLTGTDEHGANIETKARGLKLKPQEYADKIAAQFRRVWQELNISNDNFLRTSDKSHIKAVQKALEFMRDKGDIYLSKYEGLYCRGCEQYKNERDLVDGLCPDHKVAPEKMSEESYNFKLSKYQDELLKKIKKDELKILPVKRKNEIVSFYEKEGLTDVSFSRKNVSWGIPVPWDKSHTVYVWADAFLNYLTGLDWNGPLAPFSKGGKGDFTLTPPLIKARFAHARFDEPKTRREACLAEPRRTRRGGRGDFWPPSVQLMSKDILRVHATIWPAMLLSLGLKLPKKIFVHGYFLINGQKMSKTLGNVIAPADLIKKYGLDASRYLIMSATAFGHDGDIGWEKFNDKYNADLANGLGNLVARVSNLIEKNKLALKLKMDSDKKLFKAYKESMENFKFDEALKLVWRKLRAADEALSKNRPWQIDSSAKLGQAKIKKILEPLAQDILNAAGLLRPFMPLVSEKIIKQFSAKQIKKGEALFPRV